MKRSQILKAEEKIVYLKNQVSEKVTYLELPSDINQASLKRDIRAGAVQFQEISKLLEKKNHSRYVVVSANNLEYGYMAVMYHAACMHVMQDGDTGKEEIEFETKPNPDNFALGLWNEASQEQWIECWNRIPVLCPSDLQSYLQNPNENIFFGGFPMQQSNRGLNFRPYWMDCTKEAVCIVSDVSSGFAGFGMPSEQSIIEALRYFEYNRIVYLLMIHSDSSGYEYFDDEPENEMMPMSCGDMLRNNIVLSFMAEEAHVCLSQEKEKQFYKYILKGNFAKYGVKVKRGFSYERLLNIIVSMKNSRTCELIEKTVKYALKDMDVSGEIVLSNDDFQFIDRFAISPIRSIASKSKKSAKERMMTELIGMSEVKQQVMDIVNVMKYNRLRVQMRISDGSYHNVHVMLGAPGTAKTTVAELMGQIMVEEKLLPDNRFISVNGAELKGMYVGHSAPKTKAIFENYDIIVIDEAYSLVDDSGNTDSFSREAIAQLIIELEAHSMDKLVIFAGYGGRDVSERNNKMHDFINANPGIKSRITSTFYFSSYSAEEMVEIFMNHAKMQKYVVEKDAQQHLQTYFARRVKDENFGNGREARSLLETCVVYAAKRVLSDGKKKYSAQELKQIKTEDVCAAIAKSMEFNDVQSLKKGREIGFMAS